MTSPEPRIIMLQSADPVVYAPMLALTARTNRLWCELHGAEYRSFVGLKRGVHPWQATLNRIGMLKELLDEGYRGWVFYLDADAFVKDLSYDIRPLLRAQPKPPLIADRGGSDEIWDVNSGVFLLNFESRLGRALARAWYNHFRRTSDKQLAAAVNWHDVTSDQQRLHQILRKRWRFRNARQRAPVGLLNYYGQFVSQMIRAMGSFDERMQMIEAATAEVIRAHEGAVAKATVA